ncbi:fanconi-associated nuclease 1 isoform X1 [Osmia lignaria lignaria]|uniref:fanconi-associated nuclease 1 isoform X1 n=1 Tax=Osmia lignaria lignaria TaxID=1437193 RepID=UPI00402B14AF
MSQQRHIDEFFKVVSNKRTSGITVKDKQRFRSTPYSRSKKKRLSLTKNVESNSMTDCTIIHENINNSYLSNLKASPIKHKTQNNECAFSIDAVEEKLSNNNELESSLSISKILSNNENTELMKTPTKKNKTDSSLSPAKSLKKEPSTPKNNHSVRGSNSPKTGSSPKKLNYSPKVPSGKSPRNSCKSLFGHTIDVIKNQAVEHMNLAKQGAISYNCFNLEEIYSKGEFDYHYNHVNTKTSVKYESSEIISPTDLHAKTLFITIFTVFSNPINCGYFDENELDFVYSIITLPSQAQTLLAHMIKRKRTWFRGNNIKYPDIAPDLKDVFTTLVSRSICTFNIENTNLATILELLQVDEIRQLCQDMNIKPNVNKKNNICKLLKLSNTQSLFPGMKSPSTVLYSSVVRMLDYCVCITDKTWNIIDKILTLLIPNQDPQISVAETFFTLCNIYVGNVTFPNIPEKRFPIFSSNLHLMSYITAKATLSITLQLIDKKKWTEVQDCGKLAINTLSNTLKESFRLKISLLPLHVRRYMPVYVWLKILSVCIDAFKKDKDKTQVVEVLHFLLEHDYYIHTKKGKWYAELALIEMYHHKNLEASASVIMKALSTEHLTRVDKVDLIERAQRILKKKTGLKPITKLNMNKTLDEHIHQMPKYDAASNIISAVLMPESGARKKTIWCVKSNAKGQSFGSVETLALNHYCEKGFSNGLHCEGALPITLFFTLFWEELFDIHVPGTFVSPYQYAPDDLFTEELFYENRKERIDMKLQIASNLNCLALSTFMEDKFKVCVQYQSIMPTNLLKDSLQLKEIVYCLGVQGVVGICRRLVENFKLWKAGFPDLIVWNFKTKEHKIVEVKGPRDSLSTKQRLWLEYLNQLGLNTELCVVEAKQEKIKQFDEYE